MSPSTGYDRARSGYDRARSGYDLAAGRIRSVSALLTTLAGLVPLASRLVRWVRLTVAVGVVCTLVIVVSPLLLGWPSWEGWVALAVAGAILGAAPFVLWLFADALDEVLALPAWLRASPTIVRDHGAELSDLVGQARAQRAAGTRRRVHGLRDGWRAGKLLLQAHAEVPGYGAALRLVSVPFLIAVALAVVGVATEVVLAPSVLVVCAALRLA